MRIGQPWPLGATATPRGVNFSVAAPLASRVELLLFADAEADEPSEVIALDTPHRSGDHWHVEVEGVGIGCCYGYRV
ncbi:MAG: glycogen-debranching protein, partial [bacterium]